MNEYGFSKFNYYIYWDETNGKTIELPGHDDSSPGSFMPIYVSNCFNFNKINTIKFQEASGPKDYDYDWYSFGSLKSNINQINKNKFFKNDEENTDAYGTLLKYFEDYYSPVCITCCEND